MNRRPSSKAVHHTFEPQAASKDLHTMSDFVNYPLDENYLSSFDADVWDTAIPLSQILAMFSAQPGNGATQQAPRSWRRSRPFAPNRSDAPCPQYACGTPHLTEPAHDRYLAVAAQVVYHGIARLPMVA